MNRDDEAFIRKSKQQRTQVWFTSTPKWKYFGVLALFAPNKHENNVDFSAWKVNHILMEPHQKGVKLLSEKLSFYINQVYILLAMSYQFKVVWVASSSPTL